MSVESCHTDKTSPGPPRRPGEGYSIMICGVEAIFGLHLERIAHRAGFSRIYRADSGEDALRLAQRCRPDVLLTEMDLPDMDGLELAHRLRRTLKTCPFVMYDELGDALEVRTGSCGCIE